VRNYSDLFLDALRNGYRALKLIVRPAIEAPKGKWGSGGTVKKRRDTLPGLE
jgi:hypothetical protein